MATNRETKTTKNMMMAQASAAIQDGISREFGVSAKNSDMLTSSGFARPKTGHSLGKKSTFYQNLAVAHEKVGTDRDNMGSAEMYGMKPRTAASGSRAARNKHISSDGVTSATTGGGVFIDGGLALGGGLGVHQPNELYEHRARCLGEDEQANRQNFDHRVKNVMQMKNTGKVLNSRVIETWINETLSDAEHLDIPGVIVKPAHKQPLNRYQIDRIYLHTIGVPPEMIDRIYRGLFVYSIGFYEMVHKSLAHAKNKYTVLSAVWKVFAILLEYCCKSNYQMMIAKISTEHKEQLDKLEEELLAEIKTLNDNEKDLKFTLDEIQRENGDLKKQLSQETSLRLKLQEEIHKNVKQHEEEVQLRLQFESKLNGLHSLHRDLQAKYDRAVNDIYNLETVNKASKERIDSQNDELIILRAAKIENEAKVGYQGERIKSLITENEQKNRQMNELETKLTKAHEMIEEKNLAVKIAEQRVNQMQLIQESEKALINGLTSEKRHLELTLKENIALKDQYKEKCDSVQDLYENLFKEAQVYKRKLVGIDEIKKDRDERIKVLRDEIEELSKKHEDLDKKHAIITVKHNALKDDHVRLNDDYQVLSKNLNLANKVRMQAEENLLDLQKQYITVKEAFIDRDKLMLNFRRKFEEESKKLGEAERVNDQLEIQKKSLEKQNEIQRKQLLDKIMQQNEQIAAEKDTREIWINRYEKEQKAHITTHTDYMTLKGKYQEVQLKYDNIKTVLDTLETAKKVVQMHLETMQKAHTSLIAKNEKLERELYTKQQLMVSVDDSNRQQVQRLKKEYVGLEKIQQAELEKMGMRYEDLRSYSVDQCQRINELLAIELRLRKDLTDETSEKRKYIKLHEDKVTESNGYRNSLEIRMREIENLKEQIDKHLNSLTEQKEILNEQTNIIADQSEEIDEQKSRVIEMHADREEQLKKQAQLIRMIEQLEQRLNTNQPIVRYNRGIQTKEKKIKEKAIQTDFAAAQTQTQSQSQVQAQAQGSYQGWAPYDKPQVLSLGQVSEGVGEQYDQPTDNSTQLDSRPRVMSATRSNFSGVQGSTGIMSYKQSSQPELLINTNDPSNQNMVIPRPTKSAANKYRNMLPSEAIAEEDYVGQLDQNGNPNPLGHNVLISGFFKKNSNLYAQQTSGDLGGGVIQDDESIQDSSFGPPIGFKMHKAEQRSHVRLKHGNSLGQQATFQMPNHQQLHSTTGVLLGNYAYNSGTVSTKEINDHLAPEAMKSVYDMRVSHTNLTARPFSQPRGNRQHLKSAVTRAGGAQRLGVNDRISSEQTLNIIAGDSQSQGASGVHHNKTQSAAMVRGSVTPATQQLLHQQRQLNFDSQMQSRKVVGIGGLPPTSQTVRERNPARHGSQHMLGRSENEMSVKGNSSIRTLIRLANSRTDTNI